MNIKQSLKNIDYACTKPQTYLVFVPVLSIVIQKIQFGNTLPLLDHSNCQNKLQINTQSRRFAKICKWHLRGSMFQTISSIIAIKLFASPLFLFIGFLAMYELGNTLHISLKHQITIFKFDSSGNSMGFITKSACNIF